MFRIRRIFDDSLPIDRKAIEQVQQILRAQFSQISEAELASLPQKLRNPFKYQFRHLLLVADGPPAGRVRGCALVSHDPELNFFFLDYLATGKQLSGGGAGGALYERVRDEAAAAGAIGVFFECLPDDPEQCDSAEITKWNVARLRFYERYGARPIANTDYQRPIKPTDRCMPMLVFDDLGSGRPLGLKTARAICRAILERKYKHLCPPDYVEAVVSSFRDDPVRLREFRYIKPAAIGSLPFKRQAHERIVLVVNDKHDIHHVRERGYVEAPVRVGAILKELEPTGLFHRIEPKEQPESCIRAVHDSGYIDYFRKVCTQIGPGQTLYRYVFPIRNATRPPKELTVRAGYYCIDTFTPLNQNAFLAARRAVDCCITAADAIIKGDRLAYALVRPPGHHAERRSFGGFCYFNSTAAAAHHLSALGRVAILDIDYHHGNGQQDIFYNRADVLTVSIHGHPSFAYPYFSGFDNERGEGSGLGFNVNYPLPEQTDGEQYRSTLMRALQRISKFGPKFLVVALGLDTAKADPTGSWTLTAKDFEENGRMIGAIRVPMLIVQEGGYRTRTLGINARHFFEGLVQGVFGMGAGVDRHRPRTAGQTVVIPDRTNSHAKPASRG